MISTLYIDGVKLDQYKDENIEVISSVLDIKDITKNTTDYTRSFTVPASRLNNQTFSHYYDFNIDDGFDARKKIDGEIHLDGIVFKTGKWRLQKVNLKKGKPESYTINFFGLLVGLKDKARDLELSDLNLSAYNHDFSSTFVYNGLTTGLFSGDIIYPCLAKKRWILDSDVVTQNETTSNVFYDGAGVNGIIWDDLRPSLKLIRIIEAIEAKLGVTFSRQFFDTSEFTNLYMWLNPDKESEIKGNTQTIDWNGGQLPTYPGDTWMNWTTDVGTYERDSEYFYLQCVITPEAGFEDVEYTIRCISNGENFSELNMPNGGEGTLVADFQSSAQNTYLVSFEVSSQVDFQYTSLLAQTRFTNPTTATAVDVSTGTAQTLDGDFVITKNIPKLKIIDFLKGIFQMFKLVIIPTAEDTYYVNTLDGYYSEGSTIDITKYINWETFDVERGDILNEISFKFQPPTTIANLKYEELNKRGYGDLIQRLYTDSTETELLDGDSFTVELPFEQIQYERLIDVQDGVVSEMQYGAVIDEDEAPANPKAHIHYAKRIGQGIKAIGFINDLGAQIQIPGTTAVWIPLHGNDFTYPIYSTTFNTNPNEWDGVFMEKNLYSNHYASYISDIFNIKKRTFKYKAVLPLRIATKLELNDVLFIKNNYYRIDKWSYNLLNGETDFELINSFETTINPFTTSATNITTNYEAKDELIYITNLNGSSSTIVVNDLGFGTAWVVPVTYETSATDPNVLTFEIAANTLETDRTASVTVTQAVTGATITIFIYQTLQAYYPSFDFTDTRNSMNIATIALRN